MFVALFFKPLIEKLKYQQGGQIMSLGQTLQQARQKAQLTQAMVAKELFVTRQTVSRWEQEKTTPNIYVLQKLSSLYKLPLTDLLSRSDQKDESQEIFNMGKINWLALFGAVIFNLFSEVLIVLAGLVATLWALTVIFTSSPLLLLLSISLGWQSFNWLQLGIGCLFCLIGVGLYPLVKKMSSILGHLLDNYVKYNLKTIKL